MKLALHAVNEMIRPLDPIRMGLKQFTIDYIEELQDKATYDATDGHPDTENHAFAYDLDNIIGIMEYGKDHDFFDMLADYVRAFMASNPPDKGSI
jgi:hypothetical protein